jgi:hypothetical protein
MVFALVIVLMSFHTPGVPLNGIQGPGPWGRQGQPGVGWGSKEESEEPGGTRGARRIRGEPVAEPGGSRVNWLLLAPVGSSLQEKQK